MSECDPDGGQSIAGFSSSGAGSPKGTMPRGIANPPPILGSAPSALSQVVGAFRSLFNDARALIRK